jgi:hypothetical protein
LQEEPALTFNEPSGHSEQLLEPVKGASYPTGQSKQKKEAFPEEYELIGQGVHSDSEILRNFPASQLTHWTEPLFTATLPAPHESQLESPGYLATVLIEHGTQVVSGPDLKNPGSQFKQYELPKMLFDFPGGQK